MNMQGLTPALSAPVIGQTASSSTSTSSSSSSNSSTSLQTEFLNLLVTELQNQDPTSPVDPTAMVGQMVSLNQLDQLISINQVLQQSLSSSPGSGTTSPTAGAVRPPASSTLQSTASGSSNALGQTASTTLPAAIPQSFAAAYPGTSSLMNLYGNLTPAAPSTTSLTSGGK